MGGDAYADDRDVVQAAAGVQYSAQATAVFKKTECSPRALPPNRMKDNTDPGLHTAAATPIVVAMDVTASRGNDAKILYDKLPMFIGSMNMNAYADNPEVSFAAIGDAPCEDRFPIQVTDFLDGKGRGDKSMDGWISSLFLEEGGGGTGEESYELTALYYARMAKLAPGVRGLFFIMGDESFYSVLKRADVDRFIGPGLVDGDVPVAHIFHELQSKFDVFMLYPRKPLEVRRKAIDEELARRLEREGAKCGDVTISLMWSTRDDLDLWVTCPSGERIMYSSKRSSCGGELDVDMNAGGSLSDKPVENVFWKGAPTGKYKVEVDLYCMRQHAPTVPFRLAITILGETEMLDGVCSESKRRVVAKEFVYDGKPPATAAEEEAKYAAYSDEHILASWSSVLPPHRILELQTPKAIVDVMLGVIAVSQADLTISAYLKDLENRGQTAERQHEVEAILTKWNVGESHFATHGVASPPVAAGTKILRAASLDKGGGAAAAAALAPADEMELLKAQLAAMQAENDRLRTAAAAAGGGAAGAGAGADAAAAAAPP